MVFRETSSTSGSNGPRMPISTSPTCPWTLKPERDSTRLPQESSSSKLRISPTDTTTSYSGGSILPMTTCPPFSLLDLSPLSSKLLNQLPHQLLISSWIKPWTRDLTPPALMLLVLLLRLPREIQPLKIWWLWLKLKVGNTLALRMTADLTFAQLTLLLFTKLLVYLAQTRLTDLSSLPRTFTP